MNKPLILISNDDGVYARGLSVLASHMKQIADIFVMAPDRDRSGASHSLTVDRPLRVTELDNGFYTINGTPKDCIHLAVTGWLKQTPTLVISGINAGYNLGDDVLYSGTVAAAMEGSFLDIPSFAISLVYQDGGPKHFKTAALVAERLVQHTFLHPLPAQTLFNINVPDIPFEDLKGMKVTRLGNRHRAQSVIQDKDPRGRSIYWVGEAGPERDAGPETDFYAVKQGYVSITPLQADLTHYPTLNTANQWAADIFSEKQ